MKKLAILLVLLLAAPSAARAEGLSRYVGEAHDLIYTVQDSNGDPVSGEAPTLLVRRDSDGFVYDWADSTFKNSAWTNKTTALTENATDGYYFKKWTPPGSETTSNSYTFLVDNANTNGYGDHQAEVVAYVTKPLHSTVAGRTIDVTATGGAGVDWSNVESPTATVALSNTMISTSQSVASVSGSVGSVSGNVGGTINGLTATAKTDAASAVWDAALSAHQTAGTAGKKLDDLPTTGTGDWTAGEKTEIKKALSVDDGTSQASENVGTIYQKVKRLTP